MKNSLKQKGTLKQYDAYTWHYTLTLNPVLVDGKKKYPQKKFTVKTTKPNDTDDVNRQINQILLKYYTGKLDYGVDMLFMEWLNLWLAEGQKRWSRAGYLRYETVVKTHLIPNLGLVRLSKLRTGHIKDLISDKTGHVPFHIYKTIRTALNAAIKDDRAALTENITNRMDTPKVESKKKIVWETKQINKFFDAAQNGRKLYYRAAVVNFHTGMRINEVFGLKFKDVDAKENIIWLQQKVEQGTVGKNTQFGKVKTETSEGGIWMTPTVRRMLAEQMWETRKAKRMAGDCWKDHGLIFAVSNGNPINLSNFDRWFYKVVGEQKLPRIRIHDIRHSVGSYLFDLGVPIEMIQEILRHSCSSFTKRQYVHTNPKVQQKTMDLIESHIGIKSKQPPDRQRQNSQKSITPRVYRISDKILTKSHQKRPPLIMETSK